ncbi:MAG: DnaJ domain-containing protein [Archangium sp.]
MFERIRAEEESRRAAEEQRQREEAESRRAAQAAREAEAARLAEEQRQREEAEARELAEEEELLKAAAVARARAEEEAARKKAATSQPTSQQSLLERMNAALRQATYVGPAPTGPTSAVPEASPSGERRREEKTDPHIVMPTAPPLPLTQPAPLPLTAVAKPAPSAPRQPLKLGGADSQDADLWSIAQPANPSAPAPVQSFEEALRRVDSSLEALVGTPPMSPAAEPMVEPIIEAEVVSTAADLRGPGMEEMEKGGGDDEAKLRRQRLLKRAMENLGSLPHREPIAPSSSGSGITAAPPIPAPSVPTTPVAPVMPPPSAPIPPPRASAPAPVAAPRPSAPPVLIASSPSRPPPSAANLQLGSQIEARFAQLSRKDHFLTLHVSQNATKEQVKGAFLNLAKTFHPDRLPPSLPHLAQKMSSVFEGIREAYETLYDETKKAAWLATRPPPAQPGSVTGSTPAVNAANQASDLFKMAEAYFKKRDYKNAEVHFGKAFAIDKSANSLSAQAWCIYMDPTRKPEGPAARQMMAKALTIDANSDRTHYQLGVIARVDGDMNTAERHFREAVRVNPRHLEANQELRLIEMRKKKAAQGPPKGGGGFFG